MQIDFHFGVMYVLSRVAGFTSEESHIIAYSSQYVDDAVNGGFIKFKNHPMFYRIPTAHEMLDVRNGDKLANEQAWMTFHFLPGGVSTATGDYEFAEKLICRQNSEIARAMVEECIRCKNDYNGLHRLGLTMHVYADTWAHQGFAGIQHKLNQIHSLHDEEGKSLLSRIAGAVDDVIDVAQSEIMDTVALGHGAAKCLPDQPYLTWSYIDYKGEIHHIKNKQRFMDAVDSIFHALKRYRDESDFDVPAEIRCQIEEAFESIIDEDAEERNQLWMRRIAMDMFGFGSEVPTYKAKGYGSWKHDALGTDQEADNLLDVFDYNSDFEQSNWKKFHTAAVQHWQYVMFDLLPEYQISIK